MNQVSGHTTVWILKKVNEFMTICMHSFLFTYIIPLVSIQRMCRSIKRREWHRSVVSKIVFIEFDIYNVS